MLVLVAGATGYVGGRLIPELLDRGHAVRALARTPQDVRQRPWGDDVEIHEGDLLDPASLDGAFADVGRAYYLVHSMGTGGGFVQRDREAARAFADAAQDIEHVVYLGGLQPDGDVASEHLSSRAEVGRVLRESLPATEFRAGPVVGAGSGSFEMLRYLTERLPVMVAPRWIDNQVQPIAVRDVVAYLVAALDVGPAGVVPIGGPDVVTFREMMQTYAQARDLDRWIAPVPVLTPRLAARWVQLVTPIPNRLAVPLIEGIVEPVVADTARARELFAAIEPVGYGEAVDRALADLGPRPRAPAGPGDASSPEHERSQGEGSIEETWTVNVDAEPGRVFEVLTSLQAPGDQRADVTEALQTLVDRAAGFPEIPRGAGSASLTVGDEVGSWRVEELEPDRRLRLRTRVGRLAEAWLCWQLSPAEGGGCRLVQQATVAPRGLAGALYEHLASVTRQRRGAALAEAIAREAEARRPRREASAHA
jgi:uncharacterized protein YbjT (DUF2867 family)